MRKSFLAFAPVVIGLSYAQNFYSSNNTEHIYLQKAGIVNTRPALPDGVKYSAIDSKTGMHVAVVSTRGSLITRASIATDTLRRYNNLNQLRLALKPNRIDLSKVPVDAKNWRRFSALVTTLTTDSVPEGTTNLYFTNARAIAATAGTYVPYAGATNDVDLGSHNLSVNTLYNGTNAANTLTLYPYSGSPSYLIVQNSTSPAQGVVKVINGGGSSFVSNSALTDNNVFYRDFMGNSTLTNTATARSAGFTSGSFFPRVGATNTQNWTGQILALDAYSVLSSGATGTFSRLAGGNMGVNLLASGAIVNQAVGASVFLAGAGLPNVSNLTVLYLNNGASPIPAGGKWTIYNEHPYPNYLGSGATLIAGLADNGTDKLQVYGGILAAGTAHYNVARNLNALDFLYKQKADSLYMPISAGGYVPYTGATSDVDLNGHKLSANTIYNDTIATNTLILKSYRNARVSYLLNGQGQNGLTAKGTLLSSGGAYSGNTGRFTDSVTYNHDLTGIVNVNEFYAGGVFNSTNSSGVSRIRGFVANNTIGASNTQNLTGLGAGAPLVGFLAQPTISTGAQGTISELVGFLVPATAGNRSTTATLSNAVGFNVVGFNASGPITNQSYILTGTATGPTGNWNLYSSTAYNNYLGAGNTLINTTTDNGTDKLQVNGGLLATKAHYSTAHTLGALDLVYKQQADSTYEVTSNKSASTALGTSNTLYPTQGAVKAYVDSTSVLKLSIADTSTLYKKTGGIISGNVSFLAGAKYSGPRTLGAYDLLYKQKADSLYLPITAGAGYVPYTGATTDVDLNSRVLKSGRLLLNGATDDGSTSLQVNGSVYAKGYRITVAKGTYNPLEVYPAQRVDSARNAAISALSGTYQPLENQRLGTTSNPTFNSIATQTINNPNGTLTLQSFGSAIGTFRNNIITLSTNGPISFTSGASSNIQANAAGAFVVNTGSVERMRIDASGNMGMGTATPVYDLDMIKSKTGSVAIRARNSMAGTGNFSDIRAESDAGTTDIASFSSTYTTAGAYKASGGLIASTGSSGLAISATNSTGIVSLYTGGNATTNERMRITANGNVGIGTTAPATKLTVSDGTGTPAAALYSNVNDLALVTATDIAPGMAYVVAGNSALNRGVFKGVRSRGSLAAPTAVQPGDQTFSLLGAGFDGTAGQATAAIDFAVESAVSANTVPQYIGFSTAATGSRLERMRVTSKGNLLINTITDNGTDKLQVNGGIHAKSVRVDTNFPPPDYVFAANYNLASLDQVRSYLKLNHHLPEVPSAKELVKNGLDLGEMNTLLLKKVEELTLYLLQKDDQLKEQTKINDEQRKASASQQDQINELKKQIALLAKAVNNK